MTTHTLLISPEDLRAALAGPDAASGRLVLLDTSFDLADPQAGERAYAEGHLPHARYAHLDRDLSGPRNGRNGRHPLPAREAFAATAGRLGIGPGVQVVVYDRQGSSYAARGWWLLRWLGHPEVAVLDGGLPAWQAVGGELVTGPGPATAQPPYPERPSLAGTIDADAVQARLADGSASLVDARAPDRYRGDFEPLDPVAGHIPGALNRFFKDNLEADGRFKPAARLRAEFEALLGPRPADQVLHQCGSGVTACHNLLAMEVAGLAGTTLYPGSWSEWCADPARPVARG